MFAHLAVAASLATCVPMRLPAPWTADALSLLRDTPVNCILLEETQWTTKLLDAAHKNQLRTLAVAHDATQADRAAKSNADAIVLEGDFPSAPGKKPTLRLASRNGLRFDTSDEVIGSTQGVWPHVGVEHGGLITQRTAAPTGSAWIHTNTGFLRYARTASHAAFWMANQPPPPIELEPRQYLPAVADVMSVGARWVIAIDAKFSQRLLTRDPAAIADWQRLMAVVRFYEDHREWRDWQPFAQLAIVQDPSNGALVTGNLLDMLAVMNTPVRAVPTRELDATRLGETKVTVTVDPRSYTPEQLALIRKFSDGGGKIVRGPDNWKMPQPHAGEFTFSKGDYKALEAIWPELHLAIQRKNFGVRMFNVSGTLTYLLRNPDGKRTVLHLVNYTDFPVENITAFVQGKHTKATLYAPGVAPRVLSIYDSPEGTGVDIDKIGTCGAVVLE